MPQINDLSWNLVIVMIYAMALIFLSFKLSLYHYCSKQNSFNFNFSMVV